MRIRCSNRDRHSQITTSAYGKYANSAVPTRPVQWENAVALPIPSQPIHTHPPPSCTRRYHLENSKRMGIVLRKMEQINQLPAPLSMEDGLCELEMVVEKRKERWALQLGAVKDNATPSQYPWEPCFPSLHPALLVLRSQRPSSLTGRCLMPFTRIRWRRRRAGV
ncbi:hypothetical protein BHM03_00045860 [Ensete ventricosum]|nr:hypothetical protein BHM03_00045860 [Ensete ventricosum]